jgi:hypothetical protein
VAWPGLAGAVVGGLMRAHYKRSFISDAAADDASHGRPTPQDAGGVMPGAASVAAAGGVASPSGGGGGGNYVFNASVPAQQAAFMDILQGVRCCRWCVEVPAHCRVCCVCARVCVYVCVCVCVCVCEGHGCAGAAVPTRACAARRRSQNAG